MLCFIVLHRYDGFFCLFVFVFLQTEGLWHPAQTECIGAIFPITFAHSVPLCHIVAMFQTCSLLLYLLK